LVFVFVTVVGLSCYDSEPSLRSQHLTVTIDITIDVKLIVI